MKTFIPLLILFLLFVNSCKDEPTAPEESMPAEEALADVTIGPEGGELRTDELLLTVPEGAFTEIENIKLFSSDKEVPFSENQISNTFRIEGIPKGFNEDLVLKIKCNKEPQGECFIVNGKEEYIIERDEYEVIYDLLESDFSAGYLICNISPESIQNNNLNKLFNNNSESYSTFVVVATHLFKTHESLTANILYTAGEPETNIKLLATRIDEAVSYFSNMNLVKENYYADKRLKIIISNNKNAESKMNISYPKDLEPMERIPQFIDNRFNAIIEKYSVIINDVFLTSLSNNEINMIAGECVYRFIRILYLGIEKNWFDWATIFWATQEFLNDAKSWGDRFTQNPIYKQPFEGIETGYLSVPTGMEELGGLNYSNFITGHGVGMSSFIEFLIKNYDQDKNLLMNIFEEIIKNKNDIPADYLIKTISVPEQIWWPEFFKAYITSNVFDISCNDFLKIIPDDGNHVFKIESPTDTLQYFDQTYDDLSAKLFRIDVFNNDIKTNGALEFNLGSSSLNLDYVKAQVFGLEDNKSVLLNEGINFIVGGLQEYSTLVVCVVNSANEPPYTGTLDISLDIRVKRTGSVLLDYDLCEIHFSADGVYDSNPVNASVVFSAEQSGDFHENIFEAKWNNTATCLLDSGKITVTIDPSTLLATYTMRRQLRDTCNGNNIIYKSYVEGANVPLVKTDENRLLFEIKGDDACNYVSKAEYEVDYGNGNKWTLVTHNCSGTSWFYLELKNK